MLQWRILVVAAIATMLGFAILQHRAIGAARIEHIVLLKDVALRERLTRENAELPALRLAGEEVKHLRQSELELAHLRAEVERLRVEGLNAAKLRAENQRLIEAENAPEAKTNAIPINYVTRAEMADAGLTSPEAAVQTYFWAMLTGNAARVQQCEAGATRNITGSEMESWSASMRRDFADFPGFFIADERNVSPDAMTVDVKAVAEGTAITMHLMRIGNEWLVE